METSRGGAAAATWIFRGTKARPRVAADARGCRADISRRRVAAAPRLRSGYSSGDKVARLRYAPPDLRGKGYAAALVRATTADLLTRPPGFAAVVVAAPALDAPTAPQKTGLWTRAGYRHVGDTAEFAFEAAPAPEPAPAAEVSSGLSALKMS